MSNPSAVPAVIDALVARFLTVLQPDQVNDGPGISDTALQQYVFVGVDDPDVTGMGEAAVSDQAWAWLGSAQRDETLQVRCVAVGWNGDTDQKKARDDAFSLMQTITDAIQADPTLGGVALYAVGVTSTTLRQTQDENGAICYLPFTVTCRARLS